MNDSVKSRGTDMIPAEHLFALLRAGSDSPELPEIGHRVDTEASNSGGIVTAFRDSSGSIGLFIPLGSDDTVSFKPDVRSRHITLRRVTWRNSPFAQLRLENLLFEEVFEIFVDTFLEEMTKSPETAVTAAADQLNRWRGLFSSTSTSVMSEEAEIGLLCELQTMSELLETEGALAFLRWTGPDRQAHDFRFDDRAIECKATQASTGLSITIHGSEQLIPEPGKRLLLVVRRYEATPTGDLSLRGLVKAIGRDPGVDFVEFHNKLRSVGYSMGHSGTDDERRYRLRENHIFEIQDEFPRVTATGLPHRIGSISYTLNLNPPAEIPGYRQTGELN